MLVSYLIERNLASYVLCLLICIESIELSSFILYVFDWIETHLGMSRFFFLHRNSSFCVKLMHSFLQRESGYPVMTSLMNSEIHWLSQLWVD